MNVNHTALTNFLWFAFLVLVALPTAFRWYRQVLISEFRAELFEVRRELFLLVARRRINPRNHVYLRLRGTLNGLLNQAESVTPLQIVLLHGMAKTRSAAASAAVVRTTEAEIRLVANPELRAELERIHTQVGLTIIRHFGRLLWLSPVGWVLLPLSKSLKAKSEVERATSRAWRNLARIVEAPATPTYQAA